MKVVFETIFEHIGYLFYAVASKDHRLSPEQVGHLHRVVESNWQPLLSADTSLQIHLLDCIHAGIAQSHSEQMSVDHAYSGFVDYYKIHSTPFSKEIKGRILQTVKLIDHEFHGEDVKHSFEDQLSRLLVTH